MDFNIDLFLEFDQKSRDKLRQQLVKESINVIHRSLKSREKKINSFCIDRVKNYLMDSPEIKSLLEDKGKLHIELGVPDASTNIERLVHYISESLVVEFNKVDNKSIDASVEIILKNSKDLKDIYSQSFAFYETEKGTKIEWLKWLLEAGNQDVIFGYKIRYGVDVGRTGDAVMIKSRQANWRVPPEFSGTIDNNFITRSLSNIEQDLATYIESIIS